MSNLTEDSGDDLLDFDVAPGSSVGSLVLSPSSERLARLQGDDESAAPDAFGSEPDEEQIFSNSKRARSLTNPGALDALLQHESATHANGAASSIGAGGATTNASSATASNSTSSVALSGRDTHNDSNATTTLKDSLAVSSSATASTNDDDNDDDDDHIVASMPVMDTRKGVSQAAGRVLRDFTNEDPSHPNWRTHHKHVFVLSSAGKPIYARYGDEQKMASFMAAISGMISFVDDLGDTIRHFYAGRHVFVFVLKGPIYLCAIADTGESPAQLALQLSYVHSQIISILTSGVNKIFRNKQSFDLRNLLGGADVFIDALLHRMEHDASFFVDAVHCARLPAPARAVVGQVMAAAAHPQLLFAIMCSNMRLVHLVRPKRFVLQPLDLHLIMNFVASSSSFRSSESWTPICLPQFNDRGFLHAHVCYIAADVCLVLVSTAADAFFELAECKKRIVTQLNAHGALQIVQQAALAPSYAVADVGVPGLLHFVYKSSATSQFTSAAVGAPYVQRQARKRLFRLYQHVFAAMHEPSPPLKVYYHTTEHETIVGWITGGFELYAIFGPLENKSAAIKACNGLLRWVKRNEASLFILSAPVW